MKSVRLCYILRGSLNNEGSFEDVLLENGIGFAC
jgi:hypothetical protein